MTLHLFRGSGLITLLVLCTFYPFFSGEYDALATPLSAMAQVLGVLGLLFVPVGVLWLTYELRKRARAKNNLTTRARAYYFAVASIVVFSIVALVVSLGAFLSLGLSFSFLTLALCFYVASRLRTGLKSLKRAEVEGFNYVPLYLVFVPCMVLIFQLALAPRATNFSRNRAIAQSAELIGDIEKYHAEHGRYPASLLALHEDYKPSVVGIEQFHYAPNGEAYNLFFEQPTFLLDFGIREIVMYNKLDEHLMVSHAAWILTAAPEQLAARQGWHTSHDSSIQHWKYFWFD